MSYVIFFLINLVFVILRLTKVIKWSWLWVIVATLAMSFVTTVLFFQIAYSN